MKNKVQMIDEMAERLDKGLLAVGEYEDNLEFLRNAVTFFADLAEGEDDVENVRLSLAATLAAYEVRSMEIDGARFLEIYESLK